MTSQGQCPTGSVVKSLKQIKSVLLDEFCLNTLINGCKKRERS